MRFEPLPSYAEKPAPPPAAPPKVDASADAKGKLVAKFGKDNEARIPEDVKSEVDTKLEALKTAAKGSDTKDLQRKMDEFNEALQKIGQHIYQGAGASTPGGAAEDGSPAGEKKKEEDVVDADYREVN